MTLRLRNVQVDVPGEAYDDAVAFWAAALDGSPRQADGPYVHLDDIRSPVGVHLQRLSEGDARYHLDLGADDPAGEVERLLALGATRAWVGDGGEVLRDPAGLLLCVCAWGTEERLRAEVTAAPRLHLVVLDVPSDTVDAVVRFWSDALGLGVHPVGGRFAAYTFLGEKSKPPLDGWGLLVQDIGDGELRIHLDLHVPTAADRDREVARLGELGASRVGQHDLWVVLAAPGGHLHCIVPDRRDGS